MKRLFILTVCLLLTVAANLNGQQVSDTSYNPAIRNPAYASGKGPVVYIDEGHNNFHTKEGRYLPFARLLERDGYGVEGFEGTFEAERLKGCRILVISNALNELNTERWYLPTPSAFTSQEIKIVSEWVRSGGSLFLIADHMPMGGAAADLASAFGFVFSNGFAVDTARQGPIAFTRTTEALYDNIITNGRDPSERVDTIVTFTGQAFTIPDDASYILRFDNRYEMLLPDTAWVFDKSTTMINIGGWSQAAYKNYGKGRVVVAGEAAMFTAQLAGPQMYRAGMNSPEAKENYQLLLNIIHWLDGVIKN
jgi:hypothetical protein